MRTIDIDAAKSIKAVIGCPKGNFKNGKCSVGTQVQSFLFAKDAGWNMKKAIDWFEKSMKKKPLRRPNKKTPKAKE